MSKRLPNIHPGEVLLEEFLEPLDLSQNAVARAIRVPPRRINEIVLGKRAITADTALRLSRYFGNSAQFWIGLQAEYDLEEARRRLRKQVQDIRPRATSMSTVPVGTLDDLNRSKLNRSYPSAPRQCRAQRDDSNRSPSLEAASRR